MMTWNVAILSIQSTNSMQQFYMHTPGITTHIHSVSKEMHHEFISFPCDPGSRSDDPGRVIYDNGNLKQVAKNPFKNVKWFSRYLEKSKGMSCFGIRKTAQIPLQSMQIWYFFPNDAFSLAKSAWYRILGYFFNSAVFQSNRVCCILLPRA